MARKLVRFGITRGIQEGASGVVKEDESNKGLGVIYGVSVLEKGPINPGDARDLEFDDESLDAVVELGNKAKLGLKARFGHPNMSSESLGTFLGRVKNFRRVGDAVRGDLYFSETSYQTPNGDLATYVLELALEDPKAFGMSLVSEVQRETRLNEDGTAQQDDDGSDLPQLARFKKLFAVDVVDDPAATKGMFSKGYSLFSDQVKLSAEATAVLDKVLNSDDAVEILANFLERYRVNREVQEIASQNETKTVKKKEANTVENYESLTIELLEKNRPDLLEQYKAGVIEEQKKESLESEKKAVESERARVKSAFVKAEAYGLDQATALEAIDKGESVEVFESHFKDKKIQNLQANSNPDSGASEPEVDDYDMSTDEGLKKAWEEKPEAREGFSSFENFRAYHLNKKAVRTLDKAPAGAK